MCDQICSSIVFYTALVQVDQDCLQAESNSNLPQCEEIITPQLSDVVGTNVVTKLSDDAHYDLSMVYKVLCS